MPSAFNGIKPGEFLRKLIHISGVVVPVSIYFLPYDLVKVILGMGFAGFLIADVLRLKFRPAGKLFMLVFGNLIRDYERTRITGATVLAGSAFLVTVIFPHNIACLVLFFTTLSDGIASIVGQTIGKHRIYGSKTLEGSLSFLVVSVIIALLYHGIPLYQRLFAAVFATFIELIGSTWDDNITIPFGTGLFLEILKTFTTGG